MPTDGRRPPRRNEFAQLLQLLKIRNALVLESTVRTIADGLRVTLAREQPGDNDGD